MTSSDQMELKDLLSERRAAIEDKWFHSIAETYPADAAKFITKQKNQFTNPVGNVIREAVTGIFGRLLERLQGDGAQGAWFDPDDAPQYMDGIIRVRAVQGLTASRALSFIPGLKGIIREALGGEELRRLSDEVRALETDIDMLLLLSFDLFMKCREKIYELKSSELRNMTFRLLQRANLIGGADSEPGPAENNKEKEGG